MLRNVNNFIEDDLLVEKLEIQFSEHGNDRRTDRYGSNPNINYDRVKEIIENAFSQRILPFQDKFTHFVIRNKKDGLNIILQLIKRDKKDYLVKVITVMIKRDFQPHPGDKLIIVNERLLSPFDFLDILS